MSKEYVAYKTEVLNNKIDIAVNKTTLGTQCKNLLDVRNYASKYTAGVTASPNGVDGLTFSGTANNTFYLAWNDKAFSLKKGDYILSYAGDITSDKPNNIFLRVRKSDNTIICDLPLSQTSKSFSLNVDDELYFIAVYTNVTANVQGTIKPMIRYAEITDDTYEPYKESVDTRLTKNKSDIAVNKSALGYKRKNLLSYPKSIVKGGITFTCDENGYMTSSNTTSDSRQWTSANAQYSMYLEAGTYYFSSFAETVCTNSDGRAYILTGTQTQVVGVSTRETHVEKMFTLIESTTIYVIAKVYDGKVAFMIR